MSNGVYFTQDELENIGVEKLRNILDYLGVPFEKKNSKAKLVQLVLLKQVEMQPYLGESTPEPPKYSVRVKRIMDAKAKGELQ